VLSTRNLEAYYRIDLVIEAFARFRAIEPSATLTVAGYGSEEPRLRRLAACLGGNAIQFVAESIQDAMPRLLDDHDIFVNASTLDNQPVSILEACAAGIPIVSSSAGDIPAMVRDGETALLAPTAMPSRSATASWPSGAIRTRRAPAHVRLTSRSRTIRGPPSARAGEQIYRQENPRANQNVIIAAESR
jgi:glycosyltransferase involved in cell wall biosynthesis